MHAHRVVSLILALSMAWVSMAAGLADDAADFRKAKPKIQQRLRSRQESDRVAGVREAGKFLTLDAAKLIVQLGLSDKSEEVRKAAYEALLVQRQQPEIAQFLLKEFEKVRKTGITKESLTLVALAASTPEAATQADVVRTLDDLLGTPKADALLVAAFVDALAEDGSPTALAVLNTLVQTKHFGKHFGFHRTVVQALTSIRQREAVDMLLQLLPSLRGETLHDALKHLTAISRKNFGHKPEDWKNWWRQNRENFAFPDKPADAVALANAPAEGLRYYDLPVNAQKMVFIIDISASMRGPKMAAAQRALTNCLQNLPEHAYFNVVAFHSNVFVWQDRLVPATAENKQQAISYVNNLRPDLFTGTFDALHAATAFEPEAIYLVTDGEPTTGKIVPQPQIVDVVSNANRATRISIYTVGIQAQAANAFLQQLAGKNWGEFRDVQN